MGNITKPNTFSSGTTALSAEVNSNFDTIYNDYNGGISNANISGSAAIADTKLAQITTGGKVSFTALTVASQAAGDIMYFNGTNWVRLAKGTAGQRLTINSGETAPEWEGATAANALAGSVVQVVSTQTGAVATGTTVIPVDDTIPQNNEGNEYMTLAITPTSATNKLLIQVVINLSSNANGNKGVAALFQDSTAGALASVVSRVGDGSGGNAGPVLSFSHYMTAGTTSETTFKVRGGFGSSGTTTFNGEAGSRLMGGVMASSIVIKEIKV